MSVGSTSSGSTVGETSPAAGGWREGGPNGRREWVDGVLAGLPLPGLPAVEAPGTSGGPPPGLPVRVAYETWGTLNPERSNAVLVLHALTGDSHVVGGVEPGHPTPGWWDGLIGPGLPLDPARWFVVAPNVLGGCQGTTGPWSVAPDGRPWGARFPRISVRDQVAAEVLLADALGIDAWAAVVGGSMGGMRALEWAVSLPDRVKSLLVLAAPAASTAEQIALASAQLHAIRLDPVAGMGVARRIAHLSYRSEPELTARFGRERQADGRFAVESYLDHHAEKLIRRFDPESYVVLTEAMNGHDVGLGRGGVRAALARVTARTIVAGIDSDRLYPLPQQAEIADGVGVDLRVVKSDFGHDGFLIEVEQVGALVAELLADLPA
ncbi:homoserine O-acetyltransferase [Saccharothrix tamanrassetensis]|uniref:Homoserine O-acetyltransferase n=1 Tax=Saccharothrix tamanrassetensis TaxID=1051531 RepID=A0A841CFW3_9PSEU|nr:homoserine O-acetyltransferase [Saccharothrix tamanrassetensis]MBB5955254.1 homoserine O-acetyltransferase [Saccharothrix tamanrassetensis]